MVWQAVAALATFVEDIESNRSSCRFSFYLISIRYHFMFNPFGLIPLYFVSSSLNFLSIETEVSDIFCSYFIY
jgi:hypothetical protein